MKPVYETPRRSNKVWLIPAVLFLGFISGSVATVMLMQASAKAVEIAQESAELEARAAQEAAQNTEVWRQRFISPAPLPVKWEYKTSDTTTEEMKKAGVEGWELVTVAVLPAAGGGGDLHAYYKRPIGDGGGPGRGRRPAPAPLRGPLHGERD